VKKVSKNNFNQNEKLLNNNIIILKTGVFSSLLFITIGGFSYLLQSGTDTFDIKASWVRGQSFTSLKCLIVNCKNFDFTYFIDLGIVILLFTPFIRVFFSIFQFFKIKDKMYGFISLIVFFILFCVFYAGVF
jgi:uncharacterized membrane protein